MSYKGRKDPGLGRRRLAVSLGATQRGPEWLSRGVTLGSRGVTLRGHAKRHGAAPIEGRVTWGSRRGHAEPRAAAVR
jgi:hypothetical protein